MDTESLSKKPEKPERITFTGDLSGQEDILGCCPNAGPFPEFTMTLSGALPAGTYNGNIFMNVYGAGKVVISRRTIEPRLLLLRLLMSNARLR